MSVERTLPVVKAGLLSVAEIDRQGAVPAEGLGAGRVVVVAGMRVKGV
jgi:hypothetical protein